MTIWIGVDPGYRWTGIVARDGQRLLYWTVLDRADYGDEEADIQPSDLDVVFATISSAVFAAREDGHTAEIGYAVEWMRHPTPQVGRINPKHVMGTALVAAAVYGAYPGVVTVDPAGNGSRPLRCYPRGLVTAREGGNATRCRSWAKPAPQNTDMRHARSAWDIAGSAPAFAKLRAVKDLARS